NLTTTVSMGRDKFVKAVFGTSISNTVIGSGSVVRSPASELYPYGTKILLTGVPQPGNYFALWGNAITGSDNPATLVLAEPNPMVVAFFFSLGLGNTHSLRVLATVFGQVTNGIRGNRFGAGTNITLTALPAMGQDFLGWSGDAIGTSNPLLVIMNQNRA